MTTKENKSLIIFSQRNEEVKECISLQVHEAHGSFKSARELNGFELVYQNFNKRQGRTLGLNLVH